MIVGITLDIFLTIMIEAANSSKSISFMTKVPGD